MVKYTLYIALLLVSVAVNSQTLAEKLGYDADDKLLIITLDEGGLCQSTNDAFVQALQNPNISSASLMIPCPWIYDIAAFSKRNTKYSYGVQLTLLSEWKNKYRWSTIQNPDTVPTLVDNLDLMWSDIVDILENADTDEIYKELKAQIERAYELKIPISYLDAHMAVMSYKQSFWDVYIKLAQEYNLPVRFISESNFHGNDIEKRAQILDSLNILHPDHIIWNQVDSLHYAKAFPYGMGAVLENIKPGVTELFLRPAIYSPEIKALTNQYQNRVSEYGWAISDELDALIKKHNIKIISYKDLYDLQNQSK